METITDIPPRQLTGTCLGSCDPKVYHFEVSKGDWVITGRRLKDDKPVQQRPVLCICPKHDSLYYYFERRVVTE